MKDLLQYVSMSIHTPTLQLIFVYNASTNILSLAKDAMNELVLNKSVCSLCSLTYAGGLTKTRPWKDFIQNLAIPSIFLYKNNFAKKFPNQTVEGFPIIFLEKDGVLDVLLNAHEIDEMESLNELEQAITKALK